MKKCFILFLVVAGALAVHAEAGPFAPAPEVEGSTAVAHDHPLLRGWASGVVSIQAGLQDITVPQQGAVTWGHDSSEGRFPGVDALGPANAQDDSLPVVSLGDGGSITLSFAQPITNGPGADFAVFENGITDEFLELAFVEVSSDGVNFVRFPSVSLTPANVQIGTFGSLDPTNLHNLAGKYRTGFGTPFDLAELAGNPLLNLGSILQVRVIDVVGSVARNSQTLEYLYGRFDSLGNVINDPWTTPFETSGFDLDAIGVFHQVPEPGTALLLGLGAVLLGSRRRAARKTG